MCAADCMPCVKLRGIAGSRRFLWKNVPTPANRRSACALLRPVPSAASEKEASAGEPVRADGLVQERPAPGHAEQRKRERHGPGPRRANARDQAEKQQLRQRRAAALPQQTCQRVAIDVHRDHARGSGSGYGREQCGPVCVVENDETTIDVAPAPVAAYLHPARRETGLHTAEAPDPGTTGRRGRCKHETPRFGALAVRSQWVSAESGLRRNKR